MRFLAAVLVLLCACGSRGFDRGLLRREMQIAEQPVVTDADIAAALSRKPQLVEGFRAGIYFREPEERQSWRWTAADRERVLDAVSAADGIGEAFLISPLVVARQDLRSIRLAAAQHGADALIVVAGAADVDVSANGWAVTYLAVAPLLFVPGNDMDALFIARAAMWDVRNEFLYVTADGESARSQTRPAAFTENRKALIDPLRSEAIGQLTQELSRRLQRLAANAGRAPRPLQLRPRTDAG